MHAVIQRRPVDAEASRPTVPFYSCAAGSSVGIDGAPLDLGKLYDAPVRFRETMDALLRSGAADCCLDLSLKGDLAYYAAAWRGGRDALPAFPTLRPLSDSASGVDAGLRKVL